MQLTLWTSILSLLFIGEASSQEGHFPWPDGKKGAISLSFDDARNSHPTVGKELFRELGLKATFYVVPAAMQLHLEGWKEIVADGHEIGNHTIAHPCTGNFPWSRDKALEDYTLASMRQELLECNHQIHAMLGVRPASFAYTCGNTFVGRGQRLKSYIPLVDELFESGRGWLNEAPNDPTFADMAYLQGNEMDGKDFPEIKALIDAAVQNGSWLLLAGHEIGEGGRQTVRTKMLRELAAYLKSPECELWVGTVAEVTAHVKQVRQDRAKGLKESLTFYSSFDQGLDADFAKGDRTLYSAPTPKQDSLATANYLPAEISLAGDRGVFGNALEYKRKGEPVIFYRAAENISYDRQDWSGTVSLWLSLDPENDLAPGYTDPIQITDQSYDDAALWVDFSDQNPRDFRMGVFGDVAIWNPDRVGPDKNPIFAERLVVAEYRPFAQGKWTHVVIAFDGLNSGSGSATFYINGKSQGITKISEPFSWEEDEAQIFLGLNFIGLLDEVSIYDKKLDANEVMDLYHLTGGYQELVGN